MAGEERIERKGDGVHVYMTAVRSHFTPDIDPGRRRATPSTCTSPTSSRPTTRPTASRIGSYNINVSLEPGKHCNITFKADKAGVFPFYCTEFCSALHLEMAGYLLVEPS